MSFPKVNQCSSVLHVQGIQWQTNWKHRDNGTPIGQDRSIPWNVSMFFPLFQDSHRFGTNIKRAMVDMLNLFELEKKAK